jgi:hypothetical protein
MAEIEAILARIDANLTNAVEDIKEIKAQVKITNGSVQEHEGRLIRAEMGLKGHLIDHGTHTPIATEASSESISIPSSISPQLIKYGIPFGVFPISVSTGIGILGKFAGWW